MTQDKEKTSAYLTIKTTLSCMLGEKLVIICGKKKSNRIALILINIWMNLQKDY
jgi:hypothetical protein